MKPSKIDILNSVYGYYNFSSKIKFADFLGIKYTTLNNWYRRKTLVYEILIEKCTELDLHVLFRDGRAVPVERKEKLEDNELRPSDKSESLIELIKEKDRYIIEMSEKIGRLKEELRQVKNSSE